MEDFSNFNYLMWQFPPDNLTFNLSEVHVWQQHLELPSIQVEQCFKILNDEEKIKAQKFRFEHHQRRFIVARSTLKIILGRYLNTPPQEIEFTYSLRGKPQLADQLRENKLQFNISHSQELAIYGITCDRLIGVDLEYIRPMSDAKQLAKRFFCPQEYDQIHPLSSPDLEKAFFQLWTAKEAYLKATGEGISGGLDQVEISLEPTPQLVNLPQNSLISSPWILASFIPHLDYQAAVVVQGDDWKLRYWQLKKDRKF